MHADQFPKILGTATLNDKGQLVIPVEARNSLGLSPGSKVVIMSSPHRPALILLKAEEVEAMVQGLADALRSNELSESSESSEPNASGASTQSEKPDISDN